MKSCSFVVFIVLLGMLGVAFGGCSSGDGAPDGDRDSVDGDTGDGDLEPDEEAADPCSGAAVDCSPGVCVLHDNKAACVCPDGYHPERYSCVPDDVVDGDLEGDLDGDMPDGDEDGDYEWPEYDNWPKPLPWYELDVKPYDPENPDPNCEQDPYYPGNSTKEGAVQLESGARLVNMSLCDYGDRDWYQLDIAEDESLIIKNYGAYFRSSLPSHYSSEAIPNNVQMGNDYADWYRTLTIKANPGEHMIAIRDIPDDSQYYSFGVDFYKDVAMPSDIAYPTPLPSNHYLLTKYQLSEVNEYFPSCMDLSGVDNPNNEPGFGMIRLVYTTPAKHIIRLDVAYNAVVSLLADCRDARTEIDCLEGDGTGKFLVKTDNYAVRTTCIVVASLMAVPQSTSFMDMLFVEETEK